MSFAITVVINWNLVQRAFLGGVKIYETQAPAMPAGLKRPAILVFSKTNGYRHEEAIPAANALFAQIAKDKGWSYFQTENGAAFSPEILSRFDAVVFNNVSGDVFTPAQREAFKTWLENGGGYVGIHAAGDNSHEKWGWYVNDLIGALFIQHTMKPQFQQATVHVEDAKHPVTQGLPASWQRTEEWYSFDKSPRAKGYGILVTVDEKTYNPEGMFGKDLHMGDHPMVWWHCMGKGRVLYSAFGHRAEAYAEPEYRTLLTNAATWAMHQQGSECGTAPAAPTAEKVQ
ncbi:MAG TPA: ThuA domain-containing protein [Sphingobium sp.]|uniref:ThuA domain-containing protein n=1 Tax=Sphingobium sp. TaxID=1912891 RepID=UPI002ED3033F